MQPNTLTPRSIAQARARLAVLDRALARINKQLEDRSRARQWRQRAEHAYTKFADERDRLRVWLLAAEHPLFRASYELLKTLREQDVDFDPPELELLAKLDAHFKE